MTKQELIDTYDSMSMPEEHVAAIEARLQKLYENSAPSDETGLPAESPKEYRFERKKPSAVKAAVISISAAAAAVVLVFGGGYLINRLPISSDPPSETETTEETSEPPFVTEEIRFESADDIPEYERAGCYDEYEHTLIPGAESSEADPEFTQRLRDEKPVSVVRLEVTSANSWDEMGYTEYHAKITECLSGKQLNLNISNEVTFRLEGTHSEQIIGEPSLAAGDVLIAAAAEDSGEKYLVDPEELLFECFTVRGQSFAAQRHWYWSDLADIAGSRQYGNINRVTTVTDDPVSYYGIYEQNELAAALEQLVFASDEALALGTEPLPGLYSDFTLDFGLVEPFCYYWFDENNELISIDAREDIFGNVHGLDDEDVPDVYCAGFCEDDLGWYMQASNRNGGDSMYWIPKNDQEHMYRYDFGSDSAHTRSDYSALYLRQGKGDWSFSDPNNDGSFYASAQMISGRQPVENYVGKISWLGKEKLCADHGESWAAEFNKWYNCGETIEMDGFSYTRKLLKGAGGANPPYYYGVGDVWLIDHTDTRIVAAFRFTADDEVNNLVSARYFILTSEYQNGTWQESWQERTNIDAMMMQGVIAPANFSSGYRDEKFAWGTDYHIALITTGSDLFCYDRATDEYYLINSYAYSRYLQIDDMLYIIGRESDSSGMFLSAYQAGSGDLSFQSSYIAGSSAKEFFLSPDRKYIMIVTSDDDGQERLYVCDRYTAEFVAVASNTSGETQFTLDDSGFTIIKDGVEQRTDYDFESPDGGTGGPFGKQNDGGSNCILVTSPYINRGEMQTTFGESSLYYYDTAEKKYYLLLKGTFKAGIEDGETAYLVMDAGQGYCIYKVENGDCRTLVASAFFELHEIPSDNYTLEVRSDGNLAMLFDDGKNTVWQFNRNTGKFITAETPAGEDTLLTENVPAEGEAYYDDVFEEFDMNPSISGYPSYEELIGGVKDAEAHYGSKAQFVLCRTVRVLPNKEARKYVGSSGDRTVYEVQIAENLITGEKTDQTVMLVMTMGSPEVQKKGDPIYAPGELFTCAMLEDAEKSCMQAIYGYRYDVRTDGSNRIAYSRQNLELDGFALSGSADISASTVTSTSKNPAVYSQRLPLASVVEFVAKEWSGYGIG